jgi:hypothetical protein
VLAFIRKFIGCFLNWGRPDSRGDVHSAQIILTQAASNLIGGGPSITNYDLGMRAMSLHDETGLPVFPQAEVRLAIIKIDPEASLVGETPLNAETSLSSKEYADSGDIASLQKKYCDERGYTRVIVVTFVPHIWRAVKVYEKLGLKVIVPPYLPKMKFEMALAQSRWRRPITAYLYELLARLVFLFTGRI